MMFFVLHSASVRKEDLSTEQYLNKLSHHKKTITFLAGLGTLSCNAQNDPTEFRANLKKERMRANASILKLKKDGSLPDTGGPKLSPAEKKYRSLCAGCHGLDGAANSPTALAMNPSPRNLTDPKWQASVDDARITKVLKEGGASVGLSSTMAAWGAMLSDSDIKEMVKVVRNFKKQ
tara:strand:- start:151 stop:681 length:531 start_codon:yes stop_codon:yes gene_type:complete